jgi:hypothetical protein
VLEKIMAVMAATALLAAAHPAAAQTQPTALTQAGAWRSIYTDASVKVAIDTSRIAKRSGQTFRVRLRWQYSADQMIGSTHAYRTMIDQKLIDCATLGIKPIAAQSYDANGKAVASYDTSEAQLQELEWAVRPPESSAGKAYKAVCAAITS